jgi:cysteinyl-tRNA synthetase
MTAVPEDVRRLARRRDEARSAKDFATADALREAIREAGYEVTDTPDGPTLSPVPTGEHAEAGAEPSEVVSLLDRSPTFDATVHWIVEGWREDIDRGIRSFDRHHPDVRVQHVVVDVTGAAQEAVERVEVIALTGGTGWASARNASLVRSLGRIVLVMDGSVEATGDVVGPLASALRDPTVGVTGPFGIVTDDLREFRGSPGPDVDAIEAYLMAFRRELLVDGLRFDERFRFYRSADIELSFQVLSRGLRATVTPVPVTRHEHRMWATTPPDRRAALSKRNYYRFLDRWRGRSDLTIAGGRERRDPPG